MPFGKFKGLPLGELPDAYLRWLTTIRLRSPLQEAVEAERRRRQGAASDPTLVVAATRPPWAAEVIEAGWRHLALKHHPDCGGAHEVMVEIIEARDWLREVVG